MPYLKMFMYFQQCYGYHCCCYNSRLIMLCIDVVIMISNSFASQVNGVDFRRIEHSYAVEVLRGGGQSVDMVVERFDSSDSSDDLVTHQVWSQSPDSIPYWFWSQHSILILMWCHLSFFCSHFMHRFYGKVLYFLKSSFYTLVLWSIVSDC